MFNEEEKKLQRKQKLIIAQRSSSECCDKWKSLCRSIQFGEAYNHYATERVKYLLNEIINNTNDLIEGKIVISSIWTEQLQNDDCFEIMV